MKNTDYAKNHEGICIEFDGNSEFFHGKYKDAGKCFEQPVKDHYCNIGELRKVDYKLERPMYLEPSELESDTEAWFIKSPEWQYEEELRILLPLDLAQEVSDPNMSFFAVNPHMIKSIILGCQMSSTSKREVAEHCEKHDIRVREAFIHSHQFRLDIVDYDEANQSKYQNMYNLNRITR